MATLSCCGSQVKVGKVLVFANTKVKCEELAKAFATMFRGQNMQVFCIHGDKQQVVRADLLQKFKRSANGVLIATDVAARGLDIDDIAAVVNFDCAKNIETHVHRIGRTGRLSKRGTAAVSADKT